MTGQEIFQELNNVAKVTAEYNNSLIKYRNMCIEHKQTFPEEYMKIKNSLMESDAKLNLISNELRSSNDVVYDSNLSKTQLLDNIQLTHLTMITTIEGLDEIFKLINKLYNPETILL